MPNSKETKTLPYRPRALTALLKVNRAGVQRKTPPLGRGFRFNLTSAALAVLTLLTTLAGLLAALLLLARLVITALLPGLIALLLLARFLVRSLVGILILRHYNISPTLLAGVARRLLRDSPANKTTSHEFFRSVVMARGNFESSILTITIYRAYRCGTAESKDARSVVPLHREIPEDRSSYLFRQPLGFRGTCRTTGPTTAD